mmetsp:Transcript_13547/g.43337  ORF Transcript_13547/g.43337 Transcript_13547/m.43337 type:complete len:512 (-) Transcript_13547:942-2477(-)
MREERRMAFGEAPLPPPSTLTATSSSEHPPPPEWTAPTSPFLATAPAPLPFLPPFLGWGSSGSGDGGRSTDAAPSAAPFFFFFFFFPPSPASSPPASSLAPSAAAPVPLAFAAALPAADAFCSAFSAFLAFFDLDFPPPLADAAADSSSASSSSSKPIRSFSTSARSSARTDSSTAKSSGSRPSGQRIRTCAPCSSSVCTEAQPPDCAATQSTVLPSSSTALTFVPMPRSSSIASACPSRAALRSAASPCSDFASAPAARSVRSTRVLCSADPAAWARPARASAERCAESIRTIAVPPLPVARSRSTRSASPRAEKARTSGWACDAAQRPFQRRSSSSIASSLLKSHASASASPTASRSSAPSVSCSERSSSIATTAADEWPAATLSSEAASDPSGPTYRTISAATRSVRGCLPFFCSAVSSSSDTCCAEIAPDPRRSESSSCRPCSAIACSALYDAIDTAWSAPEEASRESCRAGMRQSSNSGDGARAAISRRVCFLVGCCHSSGCVFAS